MKRLYDASSGARDVAVDMFVLGRELNLDRVSTQNVVDYLEGEGLVNASQNAGQEAEVREPSTQNSLPSGSASNPGLLALADISVIRPKGEQALDLSVAIIRPEVEV